MKQRADMSSGVWTFGNAATTDLHLLATVIAVDDGILTYLDKRERKRSGSLQIRRLFDDNICELEHDGR